MTFDTQKLIISLYATFVFFIISHEKTYSITKSIVDIVKSKAPFITSQMVHTLVFLLIVYMMMNVQLPGVEKKTDEE